MPGSVHGRYTVEPVTFTSDGTTVRGNIYLPTGLTEPAPAVPILWAVLLRQGAGAGLVRIAAGRRGLCGARVRRERR